MQSAERRSQTRVPYRCEVESDTFRGARISDLSLNGAFIDSMSTTPVGSKLTIRFRINNREINVRGEVRHVVPQIGMGILFDELDDDEQSVLAEFIWREISSGGSHD